MDGSGSRPTLRPAVATSSSRRIGVTAKAMAMQPPQYQRTDLGIPQAFLRLTGSGQPQSAEQID